MYFDFSDQQHRDLFMRFLLGMTHDHEDASDLFQDICEYMVTHPEKKLLYRQVQRFAVNRYRNQIRRAKRSSFSIDTFEGLTQIEEIQHKQDNLIEINQEIKEEVEKLLCQIEKFPDRDRLLFKLYYLNRFTYNEIAQLTRKPVGTVKSNIHRNLQKLQKQYKRN